MTYLPCVGSTPLSFNFSVSTGPKPMAWFAVRVREKFRPFAEELFAAQGIEFFSPRVLEMRQWSDRQKPVLVPRFAGYVFCRFDPSCQLPILRTLGVIDIVRSGSRLSEVDPRELEAVERALASRQPVEPLAELITGQRVRVSSGPLQGLEGVLLECRSHWKLVLAVTMMNRSIAVQVERSQVDVLEPARA